MKHLKIFISILLVLLLSLSVAGCKKDEDASSSALSETVSDDISEETGETSSSEKTDTTTTDSAAGTTSAAASTSSSAAVTSSSGDSFTPSATATVTSTAGYQVTVPTFLTSAQQTLFAEAFEALCYIELSPGYGIGESQGDYYKCTERFTTMSAYMAYLQSLFTDDCITAIGATDIYVEIDGSLYALMAERGGNIYYSAVSFQQTSSSSSEITFTATAYYEDDDNDDSWTETYPFTLTYTSSGWRFSQFYLWY